MNLRLTFSTAALLLAGCASFKDRPLVPAKTAADFEARSLSDEGLRRFVENNLHRQVTAWNLPALTLAALYFHPDMDVARARWATAEAGKVTAGERPNPTLSVLPAYNRTTTIPSPWLVTASLDIPIETAGKRGYRIAKAAHLSEAARLNIATAAWLVRSRLRQRLLAICAARQTEALQQRQRTTQEEIVRRMQAQLDAGAVSKLDVAQAQVALDKIRMALHDAARDAAEARVQLADALGVPATALDAVSILAADFVNMPPEVPPAAVRRHAMLNRPELLSALADYAASQSALQLEIAKQYPDVHLSPGYEYDQGNDKWSLGLSVTLPAFNQNQGGIAEAEARRAESAARFNALQAQVIGEVDRAIAGYRVARQKAATAGELLANLRKQETASRAMLAAGEISKTELASMQLQIHAADLARFDAIIKAQAALGQLEDALHNPLGASSAPLPSLRETPRTLSTTRAK